MILDRVYHLPLSPPPVKCSSGLKMCAEGVGSGVIRATKSGLRPSLRITLLESREVIQPFEIGRGWSKSAVRGPALDLTAGSAVQAHVEKRGPCSTTWPESAVRGRPHN